MGILLFVALSSHAGIANIEGATRSSLVEERPPGIVLQAEIAMYVVTLMMGEGQHAECQSPENNILIQAGNNHEFHCGGHGP